MVRCLALVLTLSVFSSQISRAGELRHFSVGDWEVVAYKDDSTGAFTHCSAAASYKRGFIIFFTITRTAIGPYHS